jgi:ADP-ribosylglycohydrolase
VTEFPAITVTALVGQAVGDAYGAPFEYHRDAPDYAVMSWDEERYLDAGVDVKKGRVDPTRLPGLYTDDTQQALALLRAWMLSDDPRDGREVATRFRAIIRTMGREKRGHIHKGVHRGTGRNFRDVLRTGKPVDTAGLGAAMRIGPVATLLDDPYLVAPWVIQVSSVTTTSPVALAGAVIFAYACWQAAHPDESGVSFAGQVDGIPSNIWEVCVEALLFMNDLGEEALLEFATGTGLSNKPLNRAANGFALTGVPWVIYHAMNAESFEDAMIGVCASGGDTDTVAAMAGSLAAIRLGRRAIPLWMLEQLRGREHLFDPTLWDPIASEKALLE